MILLFGLCMNMRCSLSLDKMHANLSCHVPHTCKNYKIGFSQFSNISALRDKKYGGDPSSCKYHTIPLVDSKLLYLNTIEKMDIHSYHSYDDLLFYT